MLGRALMKAAPIARMQTRQMTVVSAPPSVRVSFAEQVVHGVIMTVGFMAVPAWVLVNMKNYRAPK